MDDKTPEGMTLIPAGTYQMGANSNQADPDEFPTHWVKVDEFYMDQTEVTNLQFKAFVDATGYITVAEKEIDWEEMKKELPFGTPKPHKSFLKAGSLLFTPPERPVNPVDYTHWWSWTVGADWRHPEGPGSSINDRMNYPVVHVSWVDAQAYARWSGKRLPTEEEWEWAAMGGLEDKKYPWGNEFDETATKSANFWQGIFPFQNLETDGFYGAAPVKSFPPNGYGLFDMAGNVWEWSQDRYYPDAYAKKTAKAISGNIDDSHAFKSSVENYTMRGGSFLCAENYCSGYRISKRMKSSKNSSFNHTGFRCVKSVE